MDHLIGKKAPTFVAKAVAANRIIDTFSLDLCQGKHVVFFFYPLDFTFVCPTELHAFQEALPRFHELGAEVVGCSVDSVYSHCAWLQTPKSQGGIEGVTYPIVADITKQIASDYGVLCEEEGIAYRGLFIMDCEGVVRHATINDLPFGRNVDEALRMVEALQYFEQNGEVCPANWSKGEKSMKPTQEGLMAFYAN